MLNYLSLLSCFLLCFPLFSQPYQDDQADESANTTETDPTAKPAIKKAAITWAESIGTYRSTGYDLDMDEEGNVYVVGNFEEWMMLGTKKTRAHGDNFRDPDIFVAKYDPEGNLLWLDHAGGIYGDGGLSIAVSGDNIYVTGYFSDIAQFGGQEIFTRDHQNMFLANYSPEGKVRWIHQAKCDGVVRGNALTVDSKGNAYITGNFREHIGFDTLRVEKQMKKNFYVVKFNPKGEVEWLQQAAGGNDLITFIYVYDIEVDGEDNVYVAGEMLGPVQFGDHTYSTSKAWYREGGIPQREIFIAQYDNNGRFQWLRTAAVEARFEDLAVDKNGKMAVAGYFDGAVNGALEGKAKFQSETVNATRDKRNDRTEDIFLALYDNDGDLEWLTTAGGIYSDRCQAVTFDESGAVYCTGYFMDTLSVDGFGLKSKGVNKDVFVAKFSAEGQLQWLERAGSEKDDQGTAIIADGAGNAIITGDFEGYALFGRKRVYSMGVNNFFLAKVVEPE